MSKYTTSPENEAEERAVMECEAVNGTSPTVETKVVIRLGTSATPTVSADKVIRMVNGTSPTARESEAVGGTPMAIKDAGGNGSVAQGNTGTPTVSTDKVLRMSKGATPTAIEATNNVGPVAEGVGTIPTAITRHEANIGGTPTAFGSATHKCYAEEGVGTPTASNSLTPTVSTDNVIRMSNGSAPTVIENTGIVGPAAEVGGSNPTVRHLRLIVCTEGTANVARSRSKTTIARTELRPIRCAEGTANVAEDRSTVAARIQFVIEDTEGSANVAKHSTLIVAEGRLAA